MEPASSSMSPRRSCPALTHNRSAKNSEQICPVSPVGMLVRIRVWNTSSREQVWNGETAARIAQGSSVKSGVLFQQNERIYYATYHMTTFANVQFWLGLQCKEDGRTIICRNITNEKLNFQETSAGLTGHRTHTTIFRLSVSWFLLRKL